MRGHIIAYTGAHGTGKTFAAMARAREIKETHPELLVYLKQENTAFCPAPVNGRSRPESALWIFGQALQRDIELLARFDIVVADRTVVDAAAYAMASGFFEVAGDITRLAAHHMHRYREIHFHTIAANDHLHADGFRDTRQAWRRQVERDLLNLYSRLGLDADAPGFFLH